MDIWHWLSTSDNQKTLAFIGGGIGAAVGLWQTIKGRKESDAAPAASASTPSTPATAASEPTSPNTSPTAPLSQHAQTSSGGVAFNIGGHNNTVTVKTTSNE